MTYVQTGKFGDIISILPILQDEFNRTGVKPVLVTSEYGKPFEKLPFLEPVLLLREDWQNLPAFIKYAKRHFENVVVPQMFGTGMEFHRKRASFQLDQWERCGAYDKWDTLPLEIPRPFHGSKLVLQHFNNKPTILYADYSQSSPFPFREELYDTLVENFPSHQVVRLSSIRLPGLLDSLVLYDAAELIVSVETVFLHLLQATDTPGIALATDSPSYWHGSAGSRRFAFYTHYDEYKKHLGFMLKKAKAVIGKKKVAADTWCIRRIGAIGDALAASVVAQRMNELGYKTEFQTHRDIHPLMRRNPGVNLSDGKEGYAQIDLDGAYEKDPDRTKKHFHQMFIGEANRRLSFYGKAIGNEFNARPRIEVSADEKDACRKILERHPKPWVFTCPRSDSHACRTVRDETWSRAAIKINGTMFWIGRHNAPPNFVDLQCRNIDDITKFLSLADLMVTVDTGPMHIASALGVPIVAITQASSPELHLSDKNDFLTISANLHCLNCQHSICPLDKINPPCQNITPESIAEACNRKLDGMAKHWVSAVVAIYKPDAIVLNRCLNALLPQVQEIIVASDMAGIVPPGAMQHRKIRYVKSWQSDIGYGRKANYGARHTNGEWILLCNDDVELAPDAVERMMVEGVPDVGIVSCLLRYRDGSIQHAGKTRRPHVRGWEHIDHRQREGTFKSATELENVCGAVMLTRRETFYKVGGFDEDFYLYTEDDAYCLAVREAGWRIVYTPHATGIHDEHLSTEKTPKIVDIMHASNRIFERKWGWYLDHNATRIPGNFKP